MLAAAKYGDLNALLRTRAGRLPSVHHFRRLLEAPTSTTVVEVLREANVPTPEDGSLPSRQWLLAQWLVPDYQVVLRRISGSAQRLVQSLMDRLELENVKYVVRSMASGKGVKTETLLNFGKVATVNIKALEGVQRMTDLQLAVKETVFAVPLRNTASLWEEEKGLFAVESALDRAVYTSLQKAAEGFRGPGAVLVRRIVAQFVATVSLLWVVRYRLAYGLTPEAVAGLSLIKSSQKAVHHIPQLAHAATFEEFRAAIQSETVMEHGQNGGTLLDWERHLMRRIRKMAHTMLYGPPFGFSVVVGFLLLKEWAIRDLSLICQGRTVGLRAEELEPMLFHDD
jgi:V/A-type H+/Na+-transporting ATPase subunit C